MKKGFFKFISIIFTAILFTSNFCSLNVFAAEENVSFFNDEDIKEMSELYETSSEYIENNTSIERISAKLNQLNAMEGITEIIEHESYTEITVTKNIYLDDQNKIPMGTVTHYIKPNSSIQTRALADKTYHEYMYIGVAVLNQYVEYTEQVLNLNQISARINDAYGTYNGVLSGSSDTNASFGVFSYSPWARTIFEVSIVGYGQVTMRASTSANNYGVWKTDWAFA